MKKLNLEKCKSGNKGITLIALIITIIVLLILAGVTIAQLTGSDSAPAKANEAKQKNDIGTARDDVSLTAQNAQMQAYEDAYVNGNSSRGSASTDVGHYVITTVKTKYDAKPQLGLATITIGDDGKVIIITTDWKQEGQIDGNGGALTWNTMVANNGTIIENNDDGEYDEEIAEVIANIDYDPQQFFTYEILTTANNQNTDIEGVASVTKVADNSDTLKVADNTVGTVKIVGFNYDYIFDGIPYSGSGSNSNSASSSGSGSNDPLANRIKEKFSTLVIPGTVKLGSDGKYNSNGTEYRIVDIGMLCFTDGKDYAIRKNVETVYISKNINKLGTENYGIGWPFYDWNALKNVYIPSTVTAFYGLGAYNIENIIIDDDNSVYDSRNDCNAVIETATNTLVYGTPKTIIPNSVQIIASQAFRDTGFISSIVIPSSVQTIKTRAFRGDLQTVYYTGTQEQWNNLTIESDNSDLVNATKVYNYNPSN